MSTMAQTGTPEQSGKPGQDKRTLDVLTLGLGDEIFAVDAHRVHEILDLVKVTKVPGANPFADGLINVRGKVTPLADPRLKLGLPCRPPTTDSRIVVLAIELDGEPITAGILADRVFEVTELPAAILEEAPRIGMRWHPDMISAVGKRNGDFIVVLNIDRLFSLPQNGDARSDDGPHLYAIAQKPNQSPETYATDTGSNASDSNMQNG